MYYYNHALFDSMVYFTDIVWQINYDNQVMHILVDKLVPEMKGVKMTFSELDNFEPRRYHKDDLKQIHKLISYENVKDLKETNNIVTRFKIDGKYHLMKGNITPNIEEDGSIHEVYVTFRDFQDFVDVKDDCEQKYGRAVVDYKNSVLDTLSGAKMGLWKMLVDGEHIQLMLDKSSASISGIDEDMSYEDAYVFLNSHIDSAHRDRMEQYRINMMNGKSDEVVYTYHHPTQGDLTIRCGGKIDRSYKGMGVMLNGYHQDISEQDKKLLLSEQALRNAVEVTQRRQKIYREISRLLAMSQNTDSGINNVLRFLGKTLGVSRVYIFEDEKEQSASNTYEWCASGIECQKERLQNITYELYDYKKKFEKTMVFSCPDISKADDEIRELLKERKLKAFLNYAIYDNGKYCGFIGVDDCARTREEWNEDSDELAMLAFVANLLSMYLIKERNLQKMEIASQAKTSFLNNMSHDIRTPMNAIVGFATLASKHLDETEKVLDYMEKIQSSSEYLLSLINDILDMSKIEAGKIIIDEKENSLIQIMTEIRNMIQADITSRNQQLEFEIINVSKENVWCDGLRLKQVLLNGVSNAMKFTPNGGKIGIYLTQKSSDSNDEAVYEFKITDTGIGMSKEFLKHVFEPFEREQNTTVCGIQGTGLGMAICKNIVDMMGGSIVVDSEKNKGTQITVNLKFRVADKENEAATSQRSETAIDNIKDIRILLVEDNLLNQEIAVELLEEAGAKVMVANDGLEAVNKVSDSSKGDIDVILMDIQMPVMGGYEATKNIRKLSDEFRANIPIIAMTANALDEDKNLSFEAGMNGFITKPFRIDELIKVISQGV